MIPEPQPSGGGDPPDAASEPSGLRGLSEAIGLSAAVIPPADPHC